MPGQSRAAAGPRRAAVCAACARAARGRGRGWAVVPVGTVAGKDKTLVVTRGRRGGMRGGEKLGDRVEGWANSGKFSGIEIFLGKF